MKFVVLLYLEDDDEAVVSLVEAQGVVAWSRVAVEGHGDGAPGWLGRVPSYRSRVLFTLVSDAKAAELLAAVAAAPPGQDPSHPVHAVQLDVDRATRSGGVSHAT
ncbi:MAG: hypothetical protein RJQ04_16210 [Longimicrobiales bacterium]